MSRALRRHIKRLAAPEGLIVTPSDVIGMRKLLNEYMPPDAELRRLGYSHRVGLYNKVRSGAMTEEDAEQLEVQCMTLAEMLRRPRRISPEFTAKGLKWFAAMRIQTRPGAPWRDTALTRQFDIAKRDILSNFERFEFVGFANPGGHWYWPVYRVHGNNEQFDYCYGSWQSGQERIYFPRDVVKVEP